MAELHEVLLTFYNASKDLMDLANTTPVLTGSGV